LDSILRLKITTTTTTEATTEATTTTTATTKHRLIIKHKLKLVTKTTLFIFGHDVNL